MFKELLNTIGNMQFVKIQRIVRVKIEGSVTL